MLRRDRALELLWTVALALFTAMAAGAALFDRFPADERIAHAVQAIDVPVFAGFIDLVNWLGNPWPGAALALLIAACCALARAPVAAVLVLLTFLAKWANSGLQELIDRPRPSPQLVDVTKQVGTASFPSGHTVGTTVVFGLLFLLLPTLVHPRAVRWPLQGACLLLIAAAGPARVYIGVHWPSDVLGGYLLAALFLLPLAAAYRSGKAEESR